jgi:putative addiction module component (TIGR02574 family)
MRTAKDVEHDALQWSWEYRDHLIVLLLGSVLSRDEPADWEWIDEAARELERMSAEVGSYPHVRPFLALVDEALTLNMRERERLMERLVKSVEADPESLSPELRDEIDRRLRNAGCAKLPPP